MPGIPVSMDLDMCLESMQKNTEKFTDLSPSVGDAMARIQEVERKSDDSTKAIMGILERISIELQKLSLVQSSSKEMVTINVPNPIVNVEAPQVTVLAPEINIPEQNIVVNVPQQEAPVVNISVPEQSVVVNVPQQEAPVVNVSVPEQNIVVNVPEQTAPVINLEPVINVPAPVVNIENKFSSENVPAEEFFVNRDVGGRIVSIEKK